MLKPAVGFNPSAVFSLDLVTVTTQNVESHVANGTKNIVRFVKLLRNTYFPGDCCVTALAIDPVQRLFHINVPVVTHSRSTH